MLHISQHLYVLVLLSPQENAMIIAMFERPNALGFQKPTSSQELQKFQLMSLSRHRGANICRLLESTIYCFNKQWLYHVHIRGVVNEQVAHGASAIGYSNIITEDIPSRWHYNLHQSFGWVTLQQSHGSIKLDPTLYLMSHCTAVLIFLLFGSASIVCLSVLIYSWDQPGKSKKLWFLMLTP